MPRKTDLNIEKLLKCTFEAIVEKNIQLYENIPVKKRVDDPFWSDVCSKYYGVYNQRQSFCLVDWFCRNTSSYADKIKDYFRRKKERISCEIEPSCSRMILQFKFEEWNTFSKYIKNNRFQSKFFEILNQRTQENGLNCYLIPINNWFNANKRSNYWNGKLKCRTKTCNLKYNAFVKCIKPFQNVEIEMEWTGNCFHDKDEIISRCTGRKRRELGLELIARGNTNVKNDIIISNETTENNCLGVLKHETVHKERLFSETFTDTLASKLVSDSLLFTTNANFEGCMHELSMNPYGFILLSDIQVKMWSQIRISNPIWYFDSTGSIIKPIKKQNKPLLFSIISYDKENHKYVPVAEFVTTSHNSISVSQKLLFIKKSIEVYSTQKDVKPKIIVVDYSWALINSSLEIFCEINNSISDYIVYCYENLVVRPNPNFSEKMIKIFICASHFLKNFSKKVQAINGKNNVSLAFIFMFTLLQNSIDLNSFEKNLIDINIVMNKKNFDEEANIAFQRLRNQLRNRKFNCQNVQCFYHTKSELDLSALTEEQMEIEDELVLECDDCISIFKEDLNSESIELNLKKNSPFKQYFENILALNKAKENVNDTTQCRPNKLYSPELFKLIRDQLHIVPLWTGILIHQDLYSYDINTRLTNNPVERWFGFLKTNLLNKRKNLNASELISPIFKYLLVLFLQLYMKNEHVKEEIINPKHVYVENWDDGKSKKRKKGALFYENFEMDSKKSDDIPDEQFMKLFEPEILRSNQTFHSNISVVSKIFYELKLIYDKHFIKENNNIDFTIFASKKNLFDLLIKQLRSQTNSFYYKNEKVDKDFDLIIKLNNLEGLNAIDIEKKGNCFYQSISKLIFGEQKYYYLIRLATFYTLLEYRDFFSIALEKLHYGESVDEFIQRNYKDKVWANEILIVASSISLKRPILSFSIDPKKILPNNIVFSFKTELDNPLIIAFNVNHFVPLMQTTKFPKIPIIENHLLKEFYSFLNVN